MSEPPAAGKKQQPTGDRTRIRALRHAAIAIACALTTALIAYVGWFSAFAAADPVEANEQVLHWTGRLAALLLLLAFTASALAREKLRLGRILVRARRTLGLCMAGVMAVHLVAILLYLGPHGHDMPLSILLAGGLGYAFIFAMAATSNDFAQQRMGAWWRRLHQVGIHYLWVVLLLIYTYMSFASHYMVAMLFLVAVLAAGYLRVRNALSRALSHRLS